MPDLSQLSDADLLALHQKASAPQPGADLSSLSDDQLMALHQAATAPSPPVKKAPTLGSYVDSAVRGGAQGASLGFADEATAGVAGLKDYLAGKFGLRGDISLPDAYHTNRDAIRRADQQAEAAHPGLYTGSQIAGGVLSAFAPGVGALNAGKGAGVLEAAGKGAIQGGLAGAGDAKEVTDIPDAAEKGAAYGAALGGGFNLAGRAGSAVLDKLKPAKIGSALLGVPEQAAQSYIDNPAAVNAARPRQEIVGELLDRLEKLKGEVSQGSQASRQILENEGRTVSGNQLADLFQGRANDLTQRAQGIWDDPEKKAAAQWLTDMAGQYRGQNGFDQAITTNRAKDLVQTLQKQARYEVSPGQFSPIDDLVTKGAAGDVNELLKSQSPAYADQMKKVASDTQLLDQVSGMAKSPQGFDNLFKRTQKGNTPYQLDALKQFDQRTGGGLLDELQNSYVKDAFDKGATNGSRNVNLYGAMGDAAGSSLGLPGKMAGRTAGLLFGASVDKYGPSMAKGILDKTSQIQSMLSSQQGLQTLGKFAQPLAEAAQRGNQSLAATHYVLSSTDPSYRSMFDKDGEHAPAE